MRSIIKSTVLSGIFNMFKKTFADKQYLKSTFFQNVFCSSVVTSIFSLRWINCLPFSGRTPVSTNMDSLEIWGRFLIWAKEPLHLPVFGLVKSLAFPFQTESIAHGPVTLFALLFKILSKVYPPFGHFYYFVFIELLFVFLASYFTFLLLVEFRVNSFWLKLLGAATVALSFPLLYRSMNLAFEMVYIPGYAVFAYCFVRAYKYPSFFLYLILALIFPLAVLIDDYFLLGVVVMMGSSIVLMGIGYLMHKVKPNADRLRGMIAAFILGMLLSSGMTYCLGNTENLKIQSDVTPMTGRDDLRWAYGGGYGGGFHVADVLSVFIPTENNARLPPSKICGPRAYLTKLGFPITTAQLQDGQYEGFAYAGSVTIGLLLVLSMFSIISILMNLRLNLMKFDLKIISNFFTAGEFSLPLILGLSSFALYVISWGYIIHLGGVRHNDIVTPSLILAEYCHKFIWARSMGRLAIAFALFIAIGVIVWLNSFFYRYIYSEKKEIRLLCAAIFLFLTAAHAIEISGYLKKPSLVVNGDEITRSFGKQDQELIKNVLHGKKALMVTPYAMDSLDWGRICYALAYYGGVPMGGANATFFENLNSGEYRRDDEDIVSGNIRALVGRYGDIAIAAREGLAEKIAKNANLPLKFYKLRDQDAVLLTLDNRGGLKS